MMNMDFPIHATSNVTFHKNDEYGLSATSGIKKHAHNFGNPSIIHPLYLGWKDPIEIGPLFFLEFKWIC